MIVETRNGTLLFVMKYATSAPGYEQVILTNNDCWMDLDRFSNNLLRNDNNSFRDIMKVYTCPIQATLKEKLEKKKLVWDRIEQIELSGLDVSRLLGVLFEDCDVKIKITED